MKINTVPVSNVSISLRVPVCNWIETFQKLKDKNECTNHCLAPYTVETFHLLFESKFTDLVSQYWLDRQNDLSQVRLVHRPTSRHFTIFRYQLLVPVMWIVSRKDPSLPRTGVVRPAMGTVGRVVTLFFRLLLCLFSRVSCVGGSLQKKWIVYCPPPVGLSYRLPVGGNVS